MTTYETLRRILEPLGRWDADGIHRKARMRRCKRCNEYVLAGLDDDNAAMTAQCDPQPINALGEIAALFANLSTYSFGFIGGRYEIDHRTPERIEGKPAGANSRVDILAEHQCGRVIPIEHQAESNAPRTTVKGLPDEPPF